MKKQLFLLLLLFAPLMVQAQDMLPKFGYFSMNKLMKASSAYAVAQQHIAELRAKYDVEIKRSEDEFNKKYEEFLEGQRDFAPSILQKRQGELQDMMEKNIAFRKKSLQLLEQAEKDALTPVRNNILHAVQQLGSERGYAFVLNVDNDAVPFVNLAYGVNLDDTLLSMLLPR